MSPDDYPGDVTTTGELALGGSLSGRLESLGDRDWIRVRLTRGESYWFSLSGGPWDHGLLRDPLLTLHDRDGQRVTSNDDTAGGLDSRLTFTAPVSGWYYLEAGAYEDRHVGSYTLSGGGYDGGFTALRPGELAPGGSLSGELQVLGDIDWVTVELEAGVAYVINLEGVDTGQGTLIDPYLFLYDSEGEILDRADDGGVRRNSLLTYTPSEGGTFYLGVGAYQDASAGSYRLSLSAQGSDSAGQAARDGDAGEDAQDIEVGSTVQGDLSAAGERDRFRVELEAGHLYYMDLEGADSGQGSLADPYVYLLGGEGGRLRFDDDGGRGLNSRLVFSPEASGTFYLEAAAFADGQAGSYRLGVHELPSWEGELAGSLGRVSGFGVQEGDIAAGEHDWVAVTLEAARAYLFSLEGAGGDGSLADPLLSLYDANGSRVAWESAQDGASRLAFTTSATGVYYIDAGARGQDDAGRYLLSVVERQLSQFTYDNSYGDWSARDLFASGQPVMAGTSPLVSAASFQEPQAGHLAGQS